MLLTQRVFNPITGKDDVVNFAKYLPKPKAPLLNISLIKARFVLARRRHERKKLISQGLVNEENISNFREWLYDCWHNGKMEKLQDEVAGLEGSKLSRREKMGQIMVELNPTELLNSSVSLFDPSYIDSAVRQFGVNVHNKGEYLSEKLKDYVSQKKGVLRKKRFTQPVKDNPTTHSSSLEKPVNKIALLKNKLLKGK